MDELTSDTGIGTGIAEVLDAACKELAGNVVVGTDLDNIFWSSINASAQSHTAESLDSTFYNSIITDEGWVPRQQDLSALDPPSGEPVAPVIPTTPPRGEPVIPVIPAPSERDAVINQVANLAVNEVEKRIRLSGALPDDEGDYLLFTDGDEGIFVGRPDQYGKLYDDPRDHMKDLLGRFYRGNKVELEQVAQQIVTNALKGTPVDIKRWTR